MLKINGTEVPAPIKYDVGDMDISKADRNAQGDMLLEIIATKTKIELEWGKLTSAEISSLYKLIKPKFFEVVYIDPETNGEKTGTFYKGDRNTSAGTATFEGGISYWNGTKFNLIER